MIFHSGMCRAVYGFRLCGGLVDRRIGGWSAGRSVREEWGGRAQVEPFETYVLILMVGGLRCRVAIIIYQIQTFLFRFCCCC